MNGNWIIDELANFAHSFLKGLNFAPHQTLDRTGSLLLNQTVGQDS